MSPSQSSMAAGHVDLRRSRSPPSSRGARAVQASSSASQDSAHVMLSEERVSVLLEGTEVGGCSAMPVQLPTHLHIPGTKP